MGLAAIQFIPTFQLTARQCRQVSRRLAGGWAADCIGKAWYRCCCRIITTNSIWPALRGPATQAFSIFMAVSRGLSGYLRAGGRQKSQRRLAGFHDRLRIAVDAGRKHAHLASLYPLLPVAVRIGIHPEYTYCIFCFGLAGLAALGLQALPLKESLRFASGLRSRWIFSWWSGRPMNLAAIRPNPASLTKPSTERAPAQGNAPEHELNQ